MDKQKRLEDCKGEYMALHMSDEQVEAMKQRMDLAKMDRRKRKLRRSRTTWLSVAAAILFFLILPNSSVQMAYAMSRIPVIGEMVQVVIFRDYQYEKGRFRADVEVPELVMNELSVDEDLLPSIEGELQNSMMGINEEIKKISNRFVIEFEKELRSQEGYLDVIIQPEVISTTEDYFTLKLIVYQGAGSGMEWNYFYTIDLKSGKRLVLSDLFKENVDYSTPIIENIVVQMREQMNQDENAMYWIDDEVEVLGVIKINNETSFYVNEEGNIVIVFNEGDVAPMCMGVVSFEIPSEVTEDIRK